MRRISTKQSYFIKTWCKYCTMPNKGIFLHYTHYQSPQWCPTNILYAFIQLQWKFYLQFGRKIDLNHLHLSLSAWADETATNRTTAAANKFFILKKKST